MKQKGFVLWITGLPCAGKTTLADAVYEKLKTAGYKVERLDGDTVRKELTKDLDFSREGRRKNIERVAYVCSLLTKHNVGVVASFISPYKKERDLARSMCKNFIEVYVNTPLKICERRDHKGLYAKARKGKIKNFTGISDPYEKPKNAEIVICCDKKSKISENTNRVVKFTKDTLKNTK